MFTVYLSPSTQEHNVGAIPGYIEETQMNKVADAVERQLKKYSQIAILRNKPSMGLTEIFADSNKQKVDAHVAIHSNAGGGTGCEIWAYSPAYRGWKLAESIYKFMEPLTPVKDRGVKSGGTNYGELGKVVAPSCIVEIDFHDNPVRAQWIVDNIENIGIAITKGILDFLGVDTSIPSNDYEALYLAEQKKRQEAEANVLSLQNQLANANSQLKAEQDKIARIKFFVGGI